MNKKVLVVALTAVALGLTACGGNGNGSSQQVSIDGSSTVYPLTAVAAELYQQENPDVRVVVGSSGTGGGFEKFCRGEIDINDASRHISPSEIEACNESGIGYLPLTLATDAITVVVSQTSDLPECLTVEELEAIWEPSSWINTWDQFDSKLDNKELQLYSPGTDSGTFDFFTEVIMGEAGMQRTDITPSEDDNVLVTGISRDPNAMGYLGYTYYEQNRDSLRAVAIDEGKGCVFPTFNTVLNGTYSQLARPLLVYISTEALKKQEVKDFVEFFVENSMEIAEDAMFIKLDSNGLLKLNEYAKLIYDNEVGVLK